MSGRDVFICDYTRTPIGRYGGALASVRADDLAALPLKTLMDRAPALDAAAIGEVFLGCANQAGEDSRNIARQAALLAGLPESVPGVTLNRLCGSGMDAVGSAARAIACGDIGLALAGGVESMTRAPLVMGKAANAFQRTTEIHDSTIGWRFVNPKMEAAYGVESMPETGENVATGWNISRADQDAMALRSQQRAGAAIANGFFAGEITPVVLPQRKGVITITEDEHPRPATTPDALAGLRPIVRADGTVTAGNAAGINDGAAALLLADADHARRFGLVPKARILGMATAGVAPRVMGIGPVPAVRKLLERLQLKLADFATIELNEAFAAQGLAVLRDLELADDDPRVNPNGGAIALGHPLGMTGARLVMTAVHQLEKTGGRYGLATMCIGVGQGIALAVERL
jgi:3-oxoadipyl-CoA thiolase